MGTRLGAEGASFLDVGTGVGWLAIAMARAFPSLRVVGLDIVSSFPRMEETAATRIANVNRHRIIRRARPYGPPLDPALHPSRMSVDDGTERGLYFLCFNTNLRRQFEFVQSTWAINPAFAGLSADPDPLLRASRSVPYPASNHTIQGSPECPARTIRDVPRFVEVTGGGYFFMPGRRALAYLASLG